MNPSTIEIYKSRGLFRFRLIRPENREIVGQGVRGYKELKTLLSHLSSLIHYIDAPYLDEVAIYKDKSKCYRFRLWVFVDEKWCKVIRSEAYTQRHNAVAGLESCRWCLEAGKVALLFSENSDVHDLDTLTDPATDLNQFVGK